MGNKPGDRCELSRQKARHRPLSISSAAGHAPRIYKSGFVRRVSVDRSQPRWTHTDRAAGQRVRQALRGCFPLRVAETNNSRWGSSFCALLARNRSETACYILSMPLLAPEAIVLHAFDYLESSRIIRLLTREAGVQSALARGARKSRGRYGTALDLFAEGSAQLYVKPNRELHNLASFEISRSRGELAEDLGRFTAASAIAELALRFAGEADNPQLYDTVADVLDRIARSEPERTIEDGLAGCWRVVSVLGFTPELSSCALCHTPLRDAEDTTFSHSSGGIDCLACRKSAPGGRRLPCAARVAIQQWLEGDDSAHLTDAEARSHQRLLREFLGAHLADERPLRAFARWGNERWSAA